VLDSGEANVTADGDKKGILFTKKISAERYTTLWRSRIVALPFVLTCGLFNTLNYGYERLPDLLLHLQDIHLQA